jgi:hypothetical protein
MLVKVVNDNVHPYREKFRGKDIYIEPKGAIEMDLNDAHAFLGTMPPNIEVDANGIQKPTSYKQLRIEKAGAPKAPASKSFVCMKDGKEFGSQAELDRHIEENFADDIVDEEAREKVVAKRRGRKPKEG